MYQWQTTDGGQRVLDDPVQMEDDHKRLML